VKFSGATAKAARCAAFFARMRRRVPQGFPFIVKSGSSGISVCRKRMQPMVDSASTFLPSFRRTPESRAAPHGFRLALSPKGTSFGARLAGMTGLVFDPQESRKNLKSLLSFAL
jgi:hypothetical protein